MKRALVIMLVALAWTTGLRAEESTEAYEKRMQWFADAKFGLFIHWGAYSVLGGVYKDDKPSGYAEWIQAGADIPKEEYEKVTRRFKPDKFDAEKWIATAKKAGMKYMVITTKHHDGFCLWDSEHTTYDIKDMAGVQTDILGDLNKACKKHGLAFGAYYSIIDWHHPSQEPNPEHKEPFQKWGGCRLTSPQAKPGYVLYMKNQLKELSDRYQPSIYWFDGDWNPWWKMSDGKGIYDYLRELQPQTIINNRVISRTEHRKDFGTPEQETPDTKLDYYWEACWTMNNSWGYSIHDKKWKSTEMLLHELVDIVSKGGNFLLNVGPRPDGTWPDECTQRLEEMGVWLAKNGDAIYGTRYADLPAQGWGRTTRNADTYYLLVFDWPEDGTLTLDGITGTVKSARLWGTKKQALTSKNLERGIRVVIPAKAPQQYVNVVELVLDGQTVKRHTAIPGAALRDKDIVLTAKAAKVGGTGKLRHADEGTSLGWWDSTDSTASWTADVPAGTYKVLLVYSSLRTGNLYEVRIGDQKRPGKAKKTGGWNRYMTRGVGEVTIEDGGEKEVVVQATKLKRDGLFNLRGVILRPEKESNSAVKNPHGAPP
jgi:alpha-L-fucosidase